MTSSAAAFEVLMWAKSMYSMAQKSKPLPNDQNIVLNRVKPVNEIIFIRQIKVQSNTKILSVSIKCSMRDLLLDVNNYA